jgi:hypothetical protein
MYSVPYATSRAIHNVVTAIATVKGFTYVQPTELATIRRTLDRVRTSATPSGGASSGHSQFATYAMFIQGKRATAALVRNRGLGPGQRASQALQPSPQDRAPRMCA